MDYDLENSFVSFELGLYFVVVRASPFDLWYENHNVNLEGNSFYMSLLMNYILSAFNGLVQN